jgi:hypothetical protein
MTFLFDPTVSARNGDGCRSVSLTLPVCLVGKVSKLRQEYEVYLKAAATIAIGAHMDNAQLTDVPPPRSTDFSRNSQEIANIWRKQGGLMGTTGSEPKREIINPDYK